MTITGICAACGRPGHRYGTTHGPNAPERWDPIACINGLTGEVDELRGALRTILDTHARPDQPGASCAEGCGGRWPCSTWAEAAHALTGTKHEGLDELVRISEDAGLYDHDTHGYRKD